MEKHIDDREEEEHQEEMIQMKEEEGDSSAVETTTSELPRSLPELCQRLTERNVLRLTPEEDALLDPIERTVRYLIPIPKHYYWDVLAEQSNNKNHFTAADIPWSIRYWHQAIGGAERLGTWVGDNLAQPVAAFLGLTGPRFHEVLSSMTPEEMRQSQRMVRERKQRDINNNNNNSV